MTSLKVQGKFRLPRSSGSIDGYVAYLCEGCNRPFSCRDSIITLFWVSKVQKWLCPDCKRKCKK